MPGPEEAGPERLLELAWGHWSIENGNHYRRDRSFDATLRYPAQVLLKRRQKTWSGCAGHTALPVLIGRRSWQPQGGRTENPERSLPDWMRRKHQALPQSPQSPPLLDVVAERSEGLAHWLTMRR